MQKHRIYPRGQAPNVWEMGIRRGFTLLEMVIVMIIIGTVTAAIFTAASAVQYRSQLNQGLAEISMIVSNMRALYAGQNISTAVNATTNNFAAATPLFVKQMVFPAEMLTPALPTTGIPAAGTVANNPWSKIAAGSAQLQLVPGNPVQFTMHYLNIPADTCVDLLVRNSLPGADTGLVQIQVDGVAVGIAGNNAKPLPITPLVAQPVCLTGATYTIDWYYSLGS